MMEKRRKEKVRRWIWGTRKKGKKEVREKTGRIK